MCLDFLDLTIYFILQSIRLNAGLSVKILYEIVNFELGILQVRLP